MKLWDFGRMESGKIIISSKVGEPLGLVNGSEVFSSMFRYEHGAKEAYEIVLSPFGPENYREIAYVTFQVRDEPGGLSQASQFLKTLNIDILNSETVSSIPNAVMIWEMLVDLSFFGDSSSLKSEFETAKEAADPSLNLVDCMHVEGSDIATRYTMGASLDSSAVKTQALRKTEKKVSIVEDGVFELPQAYRNFLGKDSSPIMLIGDPDSWILSVVFLDDETKLFKIKVDIPDRPGSIHEVMKILGNESINVVAGYTNVLVYYERMTCELVIDIRASGVKDVDDLKATLGDRMSGIGPQFALVGLSPVVF